MTKKKTAAEMVREFHETYDCPIAPEGYAAAGTAELRRLRAALVDEELNELIHALALRRSPLEGGFEEDDTTIPDLVKIADGLADMVYVLYGAALSFGIDLDAVLAEVHRSNMSKLGADGRPIYRDDMKVLKGPNYSPPNILPLLNLPPLEES